MVIHPIDISPQRGEAPLPQAVRDQAEATSEGYSFWDLLDVVNPLQHVPVVSTLYRHFTGDEIKAPARIAGGLLFGGPVGLAASAADVMLEAASGDSLGGHVMAMLDGSETPGGEGAGRALAEHRGAASAYGAAGGGGGGGFGGSTWEIDIPV